MSGGWGAGTYKYSADNETNASPVSAVDSLSGSGGNITISKVGIAYIADQGSDQLYVLDTTDDSLVNTLSINKAYKVLIDE